MIERFFDICRGFKLESKILELIWNIGVMLCEVRVVFGSFIEIMFIDW